MGLCNAVRLRAGAFLLLVAACGPSAVGGAGGSQTVGGPPGSACNPAYAFQGCYDDQPVTCAPAANAWKGGQSCPPGTLCVELPAPASPTSPKRIANCQVVADYDAAALPDAASSDADTFDGKDVGLGTQCGNKACAGGENASTCPVDCISKLRDTLICIDGACEQAWSACAQQALCLKAMNCIALCPDDACIADCEVLLGDGKAAFDKVLACTACDDAG